MVQGSSWGLTQEKLITSLDNKSGILERTEVASILPSGMTTLPRTLKGTALR